MRRITIKYTPHWERRRLIHFDGSNIFPNWTYMSLDLVEDLTLARLSAIIYYKNNITHTRHVTNIVFNPELKEEVRLLENGIWTRIK